MRNRYHILMAAMLLLTACSETKYVPEGKYLVDRVKIKSDVRSQDINVTELKSLVRQRGNARWFSTGKIPLYTYSLSGRYPQSLAELVDNYGITYDHSRFVVEYVPGAENLLPQITVITLKKGKGAVR